MTAPSDLDRRTVRLNAARLDEHTRALLHAWSLTLNRQNFGASTQQSDEELITATFHRTQHEPHRARPTVISAPSLRFAFEDAPLISVCAHASSHPSSEEKAARPLCIPRLRQAKILTGACAALRLHRDGVLSTPPMPNHPMATSGEAPLSSATAALTGALDARPKTFALASSCLLYTSDAADE